MADEHLSGIYVMGSLERITEREGVGKDGKPYKSISYVVNVRFTSKKQDNIYIGLPPNMTAPLLTDGVHYAFPVTLTAGKDGKGTYYRAREDFPPFPAPNFTK
ncbi:MAG: hypothetical protein HOO99_05020 [Hyphomicrobiaceae bacterium]|nr:hypothetical protein [Hyphomicrobiaceae bacterium]